MSDYTLTIPEEIYIRVRQIAEDTSQSIDQLMLDHLKHLSPLPKLPPDEEAELAALKHLSDDALWTIAREQMPADVQQHMQILMDKNSRGAISSDEYTQLEVLVERGQKLMVRKSEAAALLVQRGYKVTPQDMTTRE